MIKTQAQNLDTIPENVFHDTAAECFLLFQRYKLKTHMIGLNIQKETLPLCYENLDSRMTQKFNILYQRLRDGIVGLQKNFVIAQASSLRSLNNVLRNYRRKVGTLGNEPLSNFKYNRFDKNQKMLLQSLLYNETQSYDEIMAFEKELTQAMDAGQAQIEQKYRPTDKIKQDYKNVLEIIDKTQCYSYKFYDNFERSMLTSIATLESHFDKLNGYLTVWENISSLKAYEIKSSKERQMDDNLNDFDVRKRINQQENEQYLQMLMNNAPINSIQREQYKRKLNQVRHYKMEREKKLDMIGRMFNKRKNRVGILINKRKEVNVLDWYFNYDGDRITFNFQDQFRNLTAENQLNGFRPTEYERQKPFKRQNIEQIKKHLQTQQRETLNYEWWYDKYGKNGVFDLILCSSQQIQRRAEFEMTRQVELQANDDRRKKEIYEKHVHHLRDIQRRQGLHIGLLYPNNKQELEILIQKPYHVEYLPEILADHDSSISFSDDQHSQDIQKNSNPITNQQLLSEPQKNNNLTQVPQTLEKIVPLVQLGNFQKEQKKGLPEPVQDDHEDSQQPSQDKVQFRDVCLQHQLILSYFQQYAKKVVRKQDQPQYKKSKFLYYPDLSEVPWESLRAYFECEKIFILLKTGVVSFKRVFSVKQQKIKCVVHYMDQEIDEQHIKREVTSCFQGLALITVKFIPIQTVLEEGQLSAFILGLLMVLIKEEEMPQDYGNKEYIKQGTRLIQDFNLYFYPQSTQSSKASHLKKFRQNKEKQVIEPTKPAQGQMHQGKNRSLKETRPVQQKNEQLSFTSNDLLQKANIIKKGEVTSLKHEQILEKNAVPNYQEAQKLKAKQIQHKVQQANFHNIQTLQEKETQPEYDVQLQILGNREAKGPEQTQNEEDGESL